MSLAEKLMVAWVGLRGAVPIVLATFPLVAGVPGADDLFNLVFFVVLTSVLLQGTLIPPIARWLGVEVSAAPHPLPADIPVVASANATVREIPIPAGSRTVGKRILELGLPRGTLVARRAGGPGHVIAALSQRRLCRASFRRWLWMPSRTDRSRSGRLDGRTGDVSRTTLPGDGVPE
jgi:hypothetical protein